MTDDEQIRMYAMGRAVDLLQGREVDAWTTKAIDSARLIEKYVREG